MLGAPVITSLYTTWPGGNRPSPKKTHMPMLCAPPRTLAELALPYACREVVDKDADAVIDEIEAAIYKVAMTIMQVRVRSRSAE